MEVEQGTGTLWLARNPRGTLGRRSLMETEINLVSLERVFPSWPQAIMNLKLPLGVQPLSGLVENSSEVLGVMRSCRTSVLARLLESYSLTFIASEGNGGSIALWHNSGDSN